MILVWIMLPGLPLNFYRETFLESVTIPIGTYLRNNATHCATHTDVAKVYVLMNVSRKPIQSFWIGTPKNSTSIFQEVVYETLPALCARCKVQRHNHLTCKASSQMEKDGKKKKKELGKSRQVWIPKKKQI